MEPAARTETVTRACIHCRSASGCSLRRLEEQQPKQEHVSTADRRLDSLYVELVPPNTYRMHPKSSSDAYSPSKAFQMNDIYNEVTTVLPLFLLLKVALDCPPLPSRTRAAESIHRGESVTTSIMRVLFLAIDASADAMLRNAPLDTLRN